MDQEPRPGGSKERSVDNNTNNNKNNNPFGISNVVQGTTTKKGATRKNIRGKHFLPTPSATQRRIDDFYRTQSPTGSLFSTMISKGKTPKGKQPCRIPGPVGKFHLADRVAKVLGGSAVYPLSSSRKRPLDGLYKPPTHIQSRQKMSREFKKNEELQAALYSVDQDCWLQLHHHLQSKETQTKSVTEIINIQWIQENWKVLKDGRPIPILIAAILKWSSKASRNIKSGRTMTIADFTGTIPVVMLEAIATAYESILTPGTAIMLSQTRLQVHQKESLIVVPRNGLVLVATKAKLDSPLLMGRHTLELGNGVSTVELNHFDHEDALLQAQAMVAELNDENEEDESSPDVVIIESTPQELDDENLDWGDDDEFIFVQRNMKKGDENSEDMYSQDVVFIKSTPQVITIEDDKKKQDKRGNDKFLELDGEKDFQMQRKDGTKEDMSSPDVIIITTTPKVTTSQEQRQDKKEDDDENLVDWGDEDIDARLGEIEMPENDENNLQMELSKEPGDAAWDADDGLDDIMRSIEEY